MPIPALEWAKREANADQLEAEARAFLDPAGEAASWFITHWPTSMVEGSEVLACREWMIVRATYERQAAFYDSIKGRRIVDSWSANGDTSQFTPAGC